MIKTVSPKVWIQQGGGYSINLQDILNLPIAENQRGELVPFKPIGHFDNIIIEDTNLIAENLNKQNRIIYNQITETNTLIHYSDAFCEIINLIYERNGFKFRPVRIIINPDYIWVTFEHTDVDKAVETEFDDENKKIFNQILFDDITNNALVINRIITDFTENNRVSFIKPNKLKYWMRTIAYRDAENVKGEMFNNGY
jgi:hypothetical protein